MANRTARHNRSLAHRAWMFAAMLIAATTAAQGQTQTPAQPPNSRRDNLRLMEGVLTNAVKNGADALGRQMQFNDPGSIIVTGTARARGFALDGYGAFFVVDVPMMKQSVIWSQNMLMRQRQRETLKEILANTAPDSPTRRAAEAELRRLDRLLDPLSATAAPQQAQPAQVAQAGMAVAQNVPETVGAAPPLRDPNELYTEAVKSALIDAMLNFGASLVAGDEWLTVAAADSEGPQTPGQFYDASTIVLRVKGGDLADYHAHKLTREEVLTKVEIREF